MTNIVFLCSRLALRVATLPAFEATRMRATVHASRRVTSLSERQTLRHTFFAPAFEAPVVTVVQVSMAEARRNGAHALIALVARLAFCTPRVACCYFAYQASAQIGRTSARRVIHFALLVSRLILGSVPSGASLHGRCQAKWSAHISTRDVALGATDVAPSFRTIRAFALSRTCVHEF